MAVYRWEIEVCGTVQGVGYRPFVCTLARRLGLIGQVCNRGSKVHVQAQGEEHALADLLRCLRAEAPPGAQVQNVKWQSCAPLPASAAESGFCIQASPVAGLPGLPFAPDRAPCTACVAEICDPLQRRAAYPFACCTQCGPRYSVVHGLPYDRATTSMRTFALCAVCEQEYSDPWDRRFHAQATACAECGPVLALIDPQGHPMELEGQSEIQATVDLLRAGRVVAVKGLGGFCLLADATQEVALTALRTRKQRPTRPFACLAPNLAMVRSWCEVDEEAARLLESAAAPIVVLPLLPQHGAGGGQGWPAWVAPELKHLGWMLPSTLLHYLLAQAFGRPLVCTSANLRGEPLCLSARQVIEGLAGEVDAILDHNRPLVRPLDDSVVRRALGLTLMVRRARGYVPQATQLQCPWLPVPSSLPVPSPSRQDSMGPPPQGPDNPSKHLASAPFGTPFHLQVGIRPTLALGAQLKATVCFAEGKQAWLSQHLGDLERARTVDLLETTVEELVCDFGLLPHELVCDLHPDLASTRLGERLARRWGIPLRRVQHHHAHLLSTLAQPGAAYPPSQSLMDCEAWAGLAWDGAGLGDDATWWGGEALVFTRSAYRRVATLRPFPLLGGDRAAQDPRRVALALLWDAVGKEAATAFARRHFPKERAEGLLQLLGRPHLSPHTSSVGRLFDGVAALLGVCPREQSFEGEAPALLEARSLAAWAGRDAGEDWGPRGEGRRPGRGSSASPGAWSWEAGPGGVFDWRPGVRQMINAVAAGEDPGRLGLAFHLGLAELARLQMGLTGSRVALLGGGCWQNALLTRLVCDHLHHHGFDIWLPHLIPSGDGGLALGQVLSLEPGVE